MAEVAIPPETGDPAALATLIEALDAAADGARYIGGWVRDRLLGSEPHDLDIATRLPPEEALRRAGNAGLQVWSSASGLAHGTIGVVIAGRSVEVTTLRHDVATDGRHATVAFTTDWQADAARRDFTINALSASPIDGRVHDYFGGLDDLAGGCVRFIGDPLTRIAEDHLRILRFFRFQARFGRGEPHRPSYDACVARARDLMALSRERIAAELLNLLNLDDPASAVDAMLAGGILAPVLPEIVATDRLVALIAAEGTAGVAPDGIRRLAALLPRDAALAEQIAARLRLSKADRRRLTLDAAPDEAEAPHALAYRDGVSIATDRLLLAGRATDAASLAGWARPRFPLSGGQLIARGLVPGPAVARTLKAIEAQWIAEGFPDAARFAILIADALGGRAPA